MDSPHPASPRSHSAPAPLPPGPTAGNRQTPMIPPLRFCICRSAGYYLSNRARRLTPSEMMRLQGMNPNLFIQVVSDQILSAQIGNSMSVNVRS